MEAQREKARAGKAGSVGAPLNQHGSDPAALGPLPLQMGQDQSLPSSRWQGGSPQSRLARVGAPARSRALGGLPAPHGIRRAESCPRAARVTARSWIQPPKTHPHRGAKRLVSFPRRRSNLRRSCGEHWVHPAGCKAPAPPSCHPPPMSSFIIP